MDREWEQDEQIWWEQHYAPQSGFNKYNGSSGRPQGIRHYYREMLFRRVRPEVAGKLWIDVGAGNSFTIVDLIHPKKYNYRYVATDISIAGLRKSRLRTGQTPTVSSASHLPFARGRAYVVSGLGVLHHLPAWKETLRTMIELTKPGGYVMLTEAITKPRILSRWRKESYTARLDSPHEGDIDAEELKAILSEQCQILLMDYSGSPLRFALLWFAKLDLWALRSYRMTQLIVALDKLWLATIGKLMPSLWAGEIILLAQKR